MFRSSSIAVIHDTYEPKLFLFASVDYYYVVLYICILYWHHFTCICRCGYEFCYTCGAPWKDKKATCSCKLWDEDYILDSDNDDDDDYETDYETDYDDYYFWILIVAVFMMCLIILYISTWLSGIFSQLWEFAGE